MVISVGGEPAHFTLDPSLGEFVLTSPKLAVPDAGKIYSVNEGNASLWDAAVAKCVRPAERRSCLICASHWSYLTGHGILRRYVTECKHPPDGGKPKSARYVGEQPGLQHARHPYHTRCILPVTSILPPLQRIQPVMYVHGQQLLPPICIVCGWSASFLHADVFCINQGHLVLMAAFARPGSMVADVHRTILYGGVFLYPVRVHALPPCQAA